MVSENDAGFRQFGRPETSARLPIDQAQLDQALLIRSKAEWLTWCIWKGAYGEAEKVRQEIRDVLK